MHMKFEIKVVGFMILLWKSYFFLFSDIFRRIRLLTL